VAQGMVGHAVLNTQQVHVHLCMCSWLAQVGPWMLQGMVGSTPVIMGRKLATTYHLTERYMEVDIDVTTCRTAGFIVQVCAAVGCWQRCSCCIVSMRGCVQGGSECVS
jgi:hypothetical protein